MAESLSGHKRKFEAKFPNARRGFHGVYVEWRQWLESQTGRFHQHRFLTDSDGMHVGQNSPQRRIPAGCGLQIDTPSPG